MKTRISFSVFLVLAAFEFGAIIYTMHAGTYGTLFFLWSLVGIIANIVALKVAQNDRYDVTAPMIGLVAHCFAWILMLGWTLHFAAFVSYLWAAIEHEIFGKGASRTCTGKCTHKEKQPKKPRKKSTKKTSQKTTSSAQASKKVARTAPTVKKAKASAAPKKSTAKKTTSTKSKKDDLTKIEGIGPKIAALLHKNNIKTFADLARKDAGAVQEILNTNNLNRHNASSWSKQAALARDEKWPALKEFQNTLHGGRKKK